MKPIEEMSIGELDAERERQQEILNNMTQEEIPAVAPKAMAIRDQCIARALELHLQAIRKLNGLGNLPKSLT